MSAGLRSLRVGLVGRGIQASRTPEMHRAEGAALGIALRYDLIDIDLMAPIPPLGDLIARACSDGYAGLNVTYPFKRAALDHLDQVSNAAAQVGAVNTIIFQGRRRFGHNTDFWGFAESMRQGLPGRAPGHVLLLGAGGAGGAVAHALADLGATTITIADRDAAAAAALAASVNATDPARAAVASDLVQAARNADGIVNATPMGMAAYPGTALSSDLLESRHWVADIVYFPLETAFLRAARARGCATLSGAGMAVFQAVRAFRLFTGLEPSSARMRATFESFDTNAPA